MQNKRSDSLDISFRNPFDDYNANVLPPELIMQYWCTPFSTGAIKDLDESSFFSEKMPIVLQGSRGSGKTTILRYFSFPVQCIRAVQSNISIRNQIINDGGVGFYLRCDESFIKLFKTVFSVSLKDTWLDCFNHYLELFFAKNIVEMLLSIELVEEAKREILDSCLPLLAEVKGVEFNTLEDIEYYLNEEIKYINRFKNEALFKEIQFSPIYLWGFYTLSNTLIEITKRVIPELSKLNFLLLIDEFEGLPIDLQEMFNNLIKFCKQGMSLRVGRRSENESIVTKSTVNNVEYLREGSDYRLIRMDYQGSEIKDIKPYLAGIAQRRLEAIENLSIPSDIVSLLGEKENLDYECEQIVNGRDKHLHEILKANPRLCDDENLRTQIIRIINDSDNILAVSLCALWVARCDEEDIFEMAYSSVNAMKAFFSKSENPLVHKFRLDFTNKYRYALTVLICAIYKKDKMYYSFNTISYLSEGNARTFINLIKGIISDAMFYERNDFIESGRISIHSQNRVIKEYSIAEFNSVCSIIHDGKSVKNLIMCIGNILSDYHKDIFVRYPETTQFNFNTEELSENAKRIIDTAESWALISRRRDKQRITAGVGYEAHLYSINRIFAPIFNISYRIRGGVNVIFSAQEIDQMIQGIPTNKLSSERKKASKQKRKQGYDKSMTAQISMFDEGVNE